MSAVSISLEQQFDAEYYEGDSREQEIESTVELDVDMDKAILKARQVRYNVTTSGSRSKRGENEITYRFTDIENPLMEILRALHKVTDEYESSANPRLEYENAKASEPGVFGSSGRPFIEISDNICFDLLNIDDERREGPRLPIATVYDNSRPKNKDNIELFKAFVRDFLAEYEESLDEFPGRNKKESNDSEQLARLDEYLDERFSAELNELEICYGKNPLSTAFLLRKLLEKGLFHSFAQHGNLDEIESAQEGRRFVSLSKMINKATQAKTEDGKHYLNADTARRVKDVKFLGDMAAHDFLEGVDNKEIESEMPKFLRAMKELPF